MEVQSSTEGRIVKRPVLCTDRACKVLNHFKGGTEWGSIGRSNTPGEAVLRKCIDKEEWYIESAWVHVELMVVGEAVIKILVDLVYAFRSSLLYSITSLLL